MTLTTEHFGEFVARVHGHDPFPWQRALLERVIEHGWPSGIDVPTGLGKTSVLDVAVFASALGASAARRRVYLVIDRRVVVDQAYGHALSIQRALAAATEGVLARVADRLRPQPAGTGPVVPLVAGRMRGGLTWSWRWLDRPDQPAIVTGTVDQLGSRLLFRGYGVGENLRSVDAALVGSDSLIVVDEAHLVEPLLTTLERVAELGRPRDSGVPTSTPTVVVMSATFERPDAAVPDAEVHGITEADAAHPEAGRRLAAPRRLHLLEAKVAKTRIVDEMAAVLVRTARQLAAGGADVVGVVANTVATARRTFDLLVDAVAEPTDHAVLLTGRQRPLDRDRLLTTWFPRIVAGRGRHEGDPLFVVATQTIEVGVDLDFAALVTESASLDAVVQRLGRLNRRALWSGAPAVVVHPAGLIDDPIYGLARVATWEWLSQRVEPVVARPSGGAPDLGEGWSVTPAVLTGAMHDLDAETHSALRPAEATAPVLFGWILDCWAQTSPAPLHSPPVGPFLHGLVKDQPTVSVLWRDVEATEADLRRSVDELPAATEEQVELPLVAVRRWLEGTSGAAAIPDVETFEDGVEGEGGRAPVTALRLGFEGAGLVQAGELRPGDVIVVPAGAGGLDAYGWAPESTRYVVDIADLAARRGGRALRVDNATLPRLLEREGMQTDGPDGDGLPVDLDLEDPAASALALLQALARRVDRSTQVGQLVHDLASRPPRATVLDAEPTDRMIGPWPGGWRVFLVGRHRSGWQSDDGAATSSVTGNPVSLAQHHAAVSQRARVFGDALGLGGEVLETVVAAAGLHDLGKADPRFQSMLRAGLPVPADLPDEKLLAKSGMDPADRAAFREAARLSGYPPGMRHEAYSLAALGQVDLDSLDVGSLDADLLCHLVAAHHGRSRPLLPAVVDGHPITYRVRVDSQTAEVSSLSSVDLDGPRRFDLLNRRFGPWGLALLETIVRLADIACSEEGT